MNTRTLLLIVALPMAMLVQKTITENAGGGKIEEIEKDTETKDGKSITVYEAKVKNSDGKKIEIKVGEDGKLIKVEND